MSQSERLPLENFSSLTAEEMEQRSAEFYQNIRERRSVRDFSSEPIPRRVIENCILAAGTAPNGANLQPWHFSVVQSPEVKAKIRLEAEAEEREFYGGRASDEWLDALAPLGTDTQKPFLETASTLIIVFSQAHGLNEQGKKFKHYYVSESVGIATGILITALHRSGCATLTHTPSPMKFLNQVLGRPKHERPFLILVVGKPAVNATVPNITKKTLEETTVWH